MAGGGQIGNKNAYKSGPLTHEQKKTLLRRCWFGMNIGRTTNGF